MKFHIAFIFLTMLLILGCATDKNNRARKINSVLSASWIKKGNIFLHEGMEATPVVLNSKLYYVVSTRLATASQGISIQIWDAATFTKIAEKPTTLGLISALVIGNRLHIFGTTNWTSKQNSIVTLSTKDFSTWTSQATLFTAPPGSSYLNTSVAPANSNGYIMAYEVCTAGFVCFNAQFKISTDLINWQDVGGIVERESYTACPTIRYVDSYYYMFFLSKFKTYFATMVARSKDLVSWEYSKHIVLSPMDGGDKNLNASDMDLVEHNGRVKIIYSIGSQTNPTATNQGIREASFDGSLSNFVNLFFNQ